MIFLYTNSNKPDLLQPQSRLSLGGYVSSSIVPNDVLNELFSEISINSERNYQEQYILLAIKNTLGLNVNNLKLRFFLNENIISIVKASLVLPDYNDCDEPSFERISNRYSKPLNATFYTIEDGDVLEVGDLDNNKVIGLWLSRKLDKDKTISKTCEQLNIEFDDNTLIEEEDSIIIDLLWDEPESISQSESQSISQSQSIS